MYIILKFIFIFILAICSNCSGSCVGPNQCVCPPGTIPPDCTIRKK